MGAPIGIFEKISYLCLLFFLTYKKILSKYNNFIREPNHIKTKGQLLRISKGSWKFWHEDIWPKRGALYFSIFLLWLSDIRLFIDQNALDLVYTIYVEIVEVRSDLICSTKYQLILGLQTWEHQ